MATPKAVFTNPDITPDDELIEATLKDSFAAWKAFTETVEGPGYKLVCEWKYYRDGGWLNRALKGTKVIAWCGVWDGYASATCYFSERHREELLELDVSEALVSKIETAEMMGKMLPVFVELRTLADVADACAVVKAKLAAK